MKVPYFDLTKQYEGLKSEFDAAISAIVKSGKFIMGDDVKEFEKEFAAYCGVKHAIGVNSGTDALRIALISMGVGAGDEVITVPYTFIATTLAISFTGAKPVFVDIDPVTYNMDPSGIEAAITKKTRAIVPVHLYGQAADMKPILKIAEEHGLKVLEDACQAHNAEYKPGGKYGRKTGSLGDMAAFSFFPTKNLGAFGDGGIILTSDDTLAANCLPLRDSGRTTRDHHAVQGYNSRLDTIQAAILRIKLRKLNEWTQSRRKAAALYNDIFKAAGDKISIPVEADYNKHVYHLYVIRVNNRKEIIEGLKKRDVQTLIHYPTPVYLQPAFGYLGHKKGDFPVSEKYCGQIISLPMFPEITEKQVHYVAKQVLELI